MSEESHPLVPTAWQRARAAGGRRAGRPAGHRRAGRTDAGAAPPGRTSRRDRRGAHRPDQRRTGRAVRRRPGRRGPRPARRSAGLGLEVTAVHPATRRIKVAGTLGESVPHVRRDLQQVRSTGPGGQVVTHRYREGPVYVPAALAGIVPAVLGLDTRPQARAHFRSRGDGSAAAQGTSYAPNQVADIYQFPAGTTGAGQTIAVIELGGGFSTSDLDTYFGGLGLAVPAISAVGVDGASNDAGFGSDRRHVEVDAGHRRHRRRRARRDAGRVLRAEQRRPGLRRRDLRGRAGHPGAHRHLDQLGPVRGLLDRAGTRGDGRGDRRRGRAGHHGVRGVR